MEIKKYKLPQVFIIANLIVIIAFFAGPFKYRIYSNTALVYEFFTCFLFYLGLKCKDIRIFKENIILKKNLKNFKLTRKEEIFLIVISIFAIGCFILWLRDFLNIAGSNYIFADGDYRRKLSLNRTNLSRISQFGLSSGMAVYLITSLAQDIHYKLTKVLSFIDFWLLGITNLFVGARWSIVISLIIYIYISKNVRYKLKNSIKKLSRLKKVLIIIAAIVIAYIVMHLFNVRGTNNFSKIYLFNYGDVEMRGVYREIYRYFGNHVNTIYKLLEYISHPIAVFSYIFCEYIPKRMYCGAYLLRSISYVFNFLGVSYFDNSNIVATTFSGLYSGFIYGFIIDFSIYLAPFAIFLNGVLFSKIYKKRDENVFAKIMSSIIFTMVLFSPIYYFWHLGGLDFVIIWIVIILLGVKLLSRV